MHEVELSCRCGQVKGVAKSVDPAEGTRVVCYCKDCQAFAHALAADKAVLDEHGGTDIYQLPPARVEIRQGQDQLRCLRLTEKGLFRWYAGCCNTPIANTVSAGIPVVGLIHGFVADPAVAHARLGPVRAYVNTGSAIGPLPESITRKSSTLRYVLKIVRKMLVWKLTGQGRPSPFFDDKGHPVSEPKILGRRDP